MDVSTKTAKTIPEIFESMMRGREFDVAELGLTFYLRTLADDSPFIAIPVFPDRVFRHSTESQVEMQPQCLVKLGKLNRRDSTDPAAQPLCRNGSDLLGLSL